MPSKIFTRRKNTRFAKDKSAVDKGAVAPYCQVKVPRVHFQLKEPEYIKGAKNSMALGDYMLAPHHSSSNLKSGVFTEKSLPDGKKMKILNRKVFNGAVKAAMDAKKAHD